MVASTYPFGASRSLGSVAPAGGFWRAASPATLASWMTPISLPVVGIALAELANLSIASALLRIAAAYRRQATWQ